MNQELMTSPVEGAKNGMNGRVRARQQRPQAEEMLSPRPSITLGHARDGELHLEVKSEDTPENYHRIALVIDMLSGQSEEEKPMTRWERIIAKGFIALVVVLGAGVGCLLWATMHD